MQNKVQPAVCNFMCFLWNIFEFSNDRECWIAVSYQPYSMKSTGELGGVAISPPAHL